MFIILALCVATDAGNLARPLDRNRITAPEAVRLDGSEVEVWFEVGKPTLAYSERGFTTVGPDDQEDEVERVVYLVGERYDIDPGRQDHRAVNAPPDPAPQGGRGWGDGARVGRDPGRGEAVDPGASPTPLKLPRDASCTAGWNRGSAIERREIRCTGRREVQVNR
jgi:hypothetical protein